MTRPRSFSGPSGAGLVNGINRVNATFGAVSSGVTTFNNLASQSSSGLAQSLLNGTGLAQGGAAVGDLLSAVAVFGGDANENDWRVRLSLPKWPSFRTSPVLKPLKEAGGLIFPYTPTVTMKAGAAYSKEPVTHTNYSFQAFKNSEPGTIEITAPMNVEDSTEALYWVACVHYLRSIAKMFAGNDMKAGNPPPIVFLNGYGNFVFKNIPVAITSFNCILPNDCDYISTEVEGSAAGAVQGVADAVGGLSGTIGGIAGSIAGATGNASLQGFASGLSDLTRVVETGAGFIGNVAGVAGSFGLGGTTSGGTVHVPTKSSFQVTLQPMYSRTSTRNFSLDRFVQGGYLNSSFGYL
jgi:hypothetical protein